MNPFNNAAVENFRGPLDFMIENNKMRCKYVHEGFYSTRAIARRLFPPPSGSYLETLAYLVANLKVNRYLRTHENAWATIS